MNKQFYSFLGLAARAGAVIYGSDAVDSGIKRGKIKLVVVDGDASDSTKKAFEDACAYYKTHIIVLEDAGELGKSLGKPGRKIIGIKDAGFAKGAIKRHELRG